MSPIPSIGLIEIIVLASMAGLACAVPLMAATVVVVVVMSRKRDDASRDG